MSDMRLAITSVRFGLNLALLRAQVAAQNIAQANRPGATRLTVDMTESLNELQRITIDPAEFSRRLTRLQGEVMSRNIRMAVSQDTSFDTEIEAMVAASGRYQALIDGVSRQLALMQLALGGRR